MSKALKLMKGFGSFMLFANFGLLACMLKAWDDVQGLPRPFRV